MANKKQISKDKVTLLNLNFLQSLPLNELRMLAKVVDHLYGDVDFSSDYEDENYPDPVTEVFENLSSLLKDEGIQDIINPDDDSHGIDMDDG